MRASLGGGPHGSSAPGLDCQERPVVRPVRRTRTTPWGRSRPPHPIGANHSGHLGAGFTVVDGYGLLDATRAVFDH